MIYENEDFLPNTKQTKIEIQIREFQNRWKYFKEKMFQS